MFFYTGSGWTAFALFFGTLIGGLIFFKDFRQDSPVYRTPWPEVILAAINVVGCGLFGWWLNRGRPRRVFEFNMVEATGHTFGFVRVEYCGAFSVLFYGYCAIADNLFP